MVVLLEESEDVIHAHESRVNRSEACCSLGNTWNNPHLCVAHGPQQGFFLYVYACKSNMLLMVSLPWCILGSSGLFLVRGYATATTRYFWRVRRVE